MRVTNAERLEAARTERERWLRNRADAEYAESNLQKLLRHLPEGDPRRSELTKLATQARREAERAEHAAAERTRRIRQIETKQQHADPTER